MAIGQTADGTVVWSGHMPHIPGVGVLPERMRRLREDLGWTQTDLARTLTERGSGVNQAHISKIENGQRQPSLELLHQLAAVLETTTDYLLGLSDNPLAVEEAGEETSDWIPGEMLRLWAELSPARRVQIVDYTRYLRWQQSGGNEQASNLAALRAALNALQRRVDATTFAAILRELSRDFPDLAGDLPRIA